MSAVHAMLVVITNQKNNSPRSRYIYNNNNNICDAIKLQQFKI